ncbi:response regulator transcription factor [Catellatospora paridis]|uniref:response regulator transcription factor n=1 Tax=Catellatospora paridis TaxID=1617086 RepID=UPI0038B2644B
MIRVLLADDQMLVRAGLRAILDGPDIEVVAEAGTGDEAVSLTAGLLLWWIGPLFPLTLFALGAGLIRSRQLPVVVGLLMCAGAILFPASRIPRIEWIAHIVDLLLLVPFAIAALHRRPASTV